MEKRDQAPQQQSSHAHTLLAALLEQAKDHALLLFDTGERIVWASPGAEAIFGLPAAQLQGLHTADLFTPEDVQMGIPGLEFETARARGSADDDRWSRRPDGSRFWASGLAYALRDETGTLVGYGKIIQNRTDWKQRQETLHNQLRELAAVGERKNIMISTLAHELRNPLTPLMNAAEMLRQGSAVDYPIQLIERQVDFINRLVEDLLDAARAKAGKLQLRRERLVLQDALMASIESVRPLLDRRSQRLEVLLAPMPIPVQADAVRLQQVFSNLLTNAAKYTAGGGTVWLEATVEDTDAVVRVQDNGVGIAPDKLHYIFELFAQAHSAPEAEGGLGIGLSLVKELVTLHGGTVQANSDGVGKGSVFIVRLPLAQAGG